MLSSTHRSISSRSSLDKQDRGLPPPSAFPPRASDHTEDYFRFEVLHNSSRSDARVGKIYTSHGVIDTPAFVPVGTNGAIKAVSSDQAMKAGVQLMFANTYHLLVHPGASTIEAAGGLHSFMRRDAPIITDSGGFQVFSLGNPDKDDRPELKSRARKRHKKGNGGMTGDRENSENKSLLKSVSENGTLFRSYRDGKIIELTPESSVQAQKQIGADIILPLDELPPYGVSRERLEASVSMSHRWMARSLMEHLSNPSRQAMYGIVHGGVDQELRMQSAEYISSLPFDGLAIGGSLGKDRKEMFSLIKWLVPSLHNMKFSQSNDSPVTDSSDRPIHLLGIADASSAKTVVGCGVDSMDSCYLTRVARHGQLLLLPEESLGDPGWLRITKTKYSNDFGHLDAQNPLSAGCECSRSYLHHLFKANEPLALSLASIHNISTMNEYMRRLRELILQNRI